MKSTEITMEAIKESAPAIFATSPSPKMSSRYVFVPTLDIMENFMNEGWNISSVRQMGKTIHGVHEIRFRNSELPKVGDTLVEAIIRNSHNGMAQFEVSTGLHRLVCSNGLTVPTALTSSFKLRHSKFDLETVKSLTEEFSNKLPHLQSAVGRMSERELTIEEKIEYVKKSAAVRWSNSKELNSNEIQDILTPLRSDDDGNSMWHTFNVVQEKFIRGGFSYRTNSGRQTKLRGITNILMTNYVNTKLWEIAEEMI